MKRSMDRFVCPPWYQCRCPAGKPVSESTMLRHMREANAKRSQIGRGPFKRGPKLTIETLDVYDFGCDDSLENHPSDAEEDESSSGKRIRQATNNPSCNQNHGRSKRSRMTSARDKSASFLEFDANGMAGSGHNHGDSDIVDANQVEIDEVMAADDDENEARQNLNQQHGFDLAAEPQGDGPNSYFSLQGASITSPQTPRQSQITFPVDDGEDFHMNSDEEGEGELETAAADPDQYIFYQENIPSGSRIPGFACWLEENIAWVELSYKHGLTHAAMDDILGLISAPCRSWKTVVSNIMESSSAIARDYVVCPGHMCYATPLGEEEVMGCSVCGKEKPSNEASGADERVSYIPLVPRFRAMFADKTLSEQLVAYRRDYAPASDGMIRDFFDSDAYRSLCDLYGGPDEMKYDLFIAASTDGFQAFKNKSCDVWPLIASLFNLPPEMRFLAKNVFPLMFIPNDVQPKDLQSFLVPFINELLSTLQGGGIEACLPNGDSIRFRIHLIWFSADLAALLKLAGITGHLGRFPCRFCLLEGYYSPDHQHYYYPALLKPTEEGEGDLRMYNPRNLVPRTPGHTETAFDRLETARNVTERKRIATETGVKGRSVLLALPNFIPFQCFPPDIMHLFYNVGMELMRHHMSGVDEGFSVTATEIGFLDAEFVGFASGISGQLATKPRPLSCFTNWKAAEHKIFTLSYSLVIFDGYLPRECLDGLHLFVQVVDLCFRSSITTAQAQEVKRLSVRFIEHFEAYYVKHNPQRVNFCKYVIHLLLHLGDAIKQYGPLISASQYWVEKYIGWILGRSNARTLPAKSMFQSAWFGEAKRLYFKQPFHELGSSYEEAVDRGGFSFLGPQRKMNLRDLNSDCNIADMIASYLIRKHGDLHPSEARRFANGIEDVTVWSRLQFVCGLDTQTASSFIPVHNNLRNPDSRRPSCYVSTEMDATDESVDVYYGKILRFLEIETELLPTVLGNVNTTFEKRYELAVIKWASGLKIGRQGQVFKTSSRGSVFGSTTVEDISTIRRLIGVVEHAVPATSAANGTITRRRKQTYFIDDFQRIDHLGSRTRLSVDGMNRRLKGLS